MASLRLEAFETPLLEPIDLQVADGECISLSGPSGCGKTRLLRAIADLDPHQGEAFIDDSPQSSMSAPTWRSRVGLLPAESFWWANRVGDHFTDMQDPLISDLGFDQACQSWEITRLSSGEKQRLSLARLLLNRPQILLLDEPTANLDQSNSTRVESRIEAWRRRHRSAVIWVTHDQAQQARVANRHFQIKAGKLQEQVWN
ncbi:MAG: ATP-binding cassette domain-containing protein [Gammaproteobacteria bacterium]|nr:ATP-binding cassette domain-containing protein [Gammaproteobacteria bacterium]